MKDPLVYLDDTFKHILDVLSVVTVLGTLANMLPSIAAIFTIIWTGIRIIETDTVRSLIKRIRGK